MVFANRGVRGGRWGGLLAALAVVVLLLPGDAGAWGSRPPAPPAAPALSEKAPDFVLRDVKGERFRLSDQRGKAPVLILFGTTWCTFCKSEIPHYKKLYETYTGQGLVIVSVDIQESQAKVSRFAAEHALPYRVLLDEDGTVGSLYDIRGVPSMVLVDREGRIDCRQCRNVESRIDALLKRR